MSVFILAAVIAYIIGGLAAPAELAADLKKYRWIGWSRLMFRPAVALVLTAILIVALIAPEWLQYPASGGIRNLALSPETMQAMLGFVAGAICRKFPFWSASAEGGDARSGGAAAAKRVSATIGILSALAVLAFLASGGSAVVDRITRVQTPVLNLQLAASASDRQLDISVDRDLAARDTIEDLMRAARFFQYDCGYAILAAGGTDRLGDRKTFAALGDYEKALAFRQRGPFANFVRRVINAKKHGDLEILKAHVRPVADKLSQLVRTPLGESAFATAYQAALDERAKQDDAIKVENDGVGNEPSKFEPDIQAKSPQPWCKDSNDKDPSAADVHDVVRYTRAFHGFVAGLYAFTGDFDGQILMYSLARAQPLLKKDINVNDGLAAALYYGGRPIGDVLPPLGAALDRLNEEDALVRAKSGATGDTSSPEKAMADELLRRYARGRINLQAELAYLWALESLRPQEKARPDEDVPLARAELYATQAYDRSRNDSTMRVDCLDDDQMISDEDTLALVKLAIQADNVRTRAAPLDRAELRKAQLLLQDARARLPRSGESCLALVAAPWNKRISSHLRLAETLSH